MGAHARGGAGVAVTTRVTSTGTVVWAGSGCAGVNPVQPVRQSVIKSATRRMGGIAGLSKQKHQLEAFTFAVAFRLRPCAEDGFGVY